MVQDRDNAADAGSPVCFMHIPKCAGSSIVSALAEALPAGSLAPQTFDRAHFGPDWDPGSVQTETRARIALVPDEVQSLAGYRAVAGHFQLRTLLEVTDARSICTVLREPRSRLLSTYMYWRVPGIFDGHDVENFRPLPVSLSERGLAHQIDNKVCRMLLHDDSRLPPRAFVLESDVEMVAADALERLAALGFVGIVERPDAMWQGIGRLFGVTLRSATERVTREMSPVAVPEGEPLFDTDTFDLLEERCAADSIVFDHVLASAVTDESERSRITEAAFATELVKLGELLGSRWQAQPDGDIIMELRCDLEKSRAELAATRHWLASVQESASWRLTAPLRAVKQRIPTAKDKRAG